MTFVPVNFDDAQEPKPAQPGVYDLQITAAEEKETGPNSKHPGSPQLKITLGFENEPNTPNITHYISLPYQGDESANFKALLLKRFLVHFKVPFDSNGIDTERVCMDMVGASARTEVSLTEPNPETGAVYNRAILPRLRDEGNQR
jgi:hypothetical protein